MTVLASASGTRIDCDACGAHTQSTTLGADVLRERAGFVLHAGRDWCADCWRALGDDRSSVGEGDGSLDRWR